MTDDNRHESADLTDYEVLDTYDTLDGPPGDDPLDRGVVTPDRRSPGIQLGSDEGIDGGAATAEEAAIHVIDADTEGTTN